MRRDCATPPMWPRWPAQGGRSLGPHSGLACRVAERVGPRRRRASGPDRRRLGADARRGESGGRKTSSDNEASWPIRKREKALKEAFNREHQAWAIASAAWAAEKRKIEAGRKLDY